MKKNKYINRFVNTWMTSNNKVIRPKRYPETHSRKSGWYIPHKHT